MDASSFVVFPNSYVEKEGSEISTTKAVEQFVRDAKKNGMAGSMAAVTEPYNPTSRHNSVINQSAGMPFFELSQRSGKPQTKFGKAFDYIKIFYRLLTKVPKQDCWYIFFPGPVGILASLIRCLQGRPFGLYVRCECTPTGVRGKLYRYIYRRADFIFATGEAITGALRQVNTKVEAVAPMMIFKPEDLCEKSTYEIQGAAKVLYLGAIHPAKGAFDFVRALPLVAGQYDVEFIIAGSGTQQAVEALEAEIQATGHPDKVVLAGYISGKKELTELYQSADIFCFPSHSEGFARVIYEAMGFALPIVSTDFEESEGKYFLRDRVNCLFIAKKDHEDTAKKILELLADKRLRESLGNTSYQQARELFARFDGVTHGGQLVEAIRSCSDGK